ncbi:MAG: hypothetical protein QOF52_3286 [Propionibacteriaceae bacterium]|nr:hypothetical protein [Propionibacteriaceae bacterium]
MSSQTVGVGRGVDPARVVPTDDQLKYASEQAWAALRHTSAVDRLRAYYDRDGGYAGSTFLTLGENNPREIDATDLFAVSLLNVKVGPLACRMLLESRANQLAISEALCAIPVDANLADASDEVWLAAERLYQLVKDHLGTNAWVTASKLCARKRPDFFPVRDNVVTFNRLHVGRDYWVDWAVYRHLIGNTGIQEKLQALTHLARTNNARHVEISDPPLKVLDALLWMSSPK